MTTNQNEEQSYLDILKREKEQEAATRKAVVFRKIKIGVAILGSFLIIWGITKMVGYKDSTELIVKQSPFGKMSCVDGQGFYNKGFARVYTYDLMRSFYFNSSTEKVNGREWEGDETDEDDISVTLSRNANANISGYLLYELPTDCDALIGLHKSQKSNDGVKHNLVRNEVLSAVRKTAAVFTAEEAKVTRIAEFRQLAEDQLSHGEYLTTIEVLEEKAGDDEYDTNGKLIKKAEVQQYRVSKLKLDSNGNRILTKRSALTEFGIKVKQFVIQSVKLDSMAQRQLDIVKEREMQRVANATEAETAKQKAVTEKAKGEARIAQAKADQEVIKITEVTQAEKEKAVATLKAEQDRDVARLNAEKAKFIADSTKQAGIAEAEANRAKRAAGLTPQEEAQNKKEIAIGIAEKLANSQGMWTPYIYNGGTGSNAGPGSQFGMALEIDMIKKVSELSKMMQQ